MIAYQEKGYGLHEAVAAAGHSLVSLDGKWTSSDDVAVQAIIDGYTLDSAKEYICTKVDALAKRKRDGIVAPFSPGEMSSWPRKLAEALAYLETGDPASAPMLVREAESRLAALSWLVGRVVRKSDLLSALEAGIAGVCGRHQDALRAATTFETVLGYDFSTGWPV